MNRWAAAVIKIRIRIKAKNTGKRVGARVVTCVKLINDMIYLLAIYDKADQSTISDKEIDVILASVGIK